MSDSSKIFRSFLERKVHHLKERRRVDQRTGRPYDLPDEAEQLAKHAKLNECRQPEGGPCQYHVTRSPNDKRCNLSARMKVSCPYLGKVIPLKAKIEEEIEESCLDEMIVEAPPKLDV